jgi:hypothetical protein
MEERLAFQMEKKAHQLEPNNVLYKWGYIFLIDVKLASSIAKGIITDEKDTIVWLKSKGSPGEYIFEMLNKNMKYNH